MPLIGNKNVKKMTKPLVDNSNKDLRGVFFAGLSSIIQGTPVDEGRARNNWFLSISAPNGGATHTQDKSGSKSQRQLERMPKTVFGVKIFFTNNMPYIERLEYGSWSDQAPSGWVRSTLVRMRNKIRSL